MRVFIAGATGVIGKRAVNQLVAAGHDVTGIARSEAKAAALEVQGAAAARLDPFDPEAVTAAVAGHDAVVNLATHIPPVSKSARADAWTENDRVRREVSRNLVDAALATRAGRYIQESITFVYPDRGDDWIDEDVPPEPAGQVASALDAESQAQRFIEGGGSGIVLRFAAFYAPDSTHTAFVLGMARRHLGAVVGPPDAWWSSIAADDAAAAVVAALDAPSGLYNVADDEPVTNREYARILGEAVGRRPWLRIPGRLSKAAGKAGPVMARSQRISNRRFKEATGWTPRYPCVRDGLPVVIAEMEDTHR